jgi:subtilase family serine protease
MRISSVRPRHWALLTAVSLTAVTGLFLSTSVAQASGSTAVPRNSAAAIAASARATNSTTTNSTAANSTAANSTAKVAAKAVAAVTAAATATKVTTQNACAAPAPGQFGCLAIRRTDIAPVTAAANATPAGYGPANLQSAYDLPSASAGGGQTVAVIEAYDDPTAEADLMVYRSQFGLPACTTNNGCFRKVNQNGLASPLPQADVIGWAAEISLDLDQVSAICPNCHILLVEANTQNETDVLTGVNAAAQLGAAYASMSFGYPEFTGETAYDSQYLNHPGMVLTASTGDSGYRVSYPAASPNVIAVGGTSLRTATGTTRGWTETAWSGAGSGCSATEPGLVQQQGLTGLSACINRADADISAIADPATGVAVYQTYNGGGWEVFGGTSVSSPIVAAAYALAGARPAGDKPGADLYTHAAQLNDVVSGSNGSCAITVLCTAGTGWDGPTGLGTPNGVSALAPSGGTGPTPVVSITNPGSQSTVVGTAVTLQVQAVDSAGLALTYRATNLPAGLAINAATGLIVGTPTTVGQSTVNLTVTDTKGVNASSAFTWSVSSAAPNKVTVSNPGSQTTPVNTVVRLQITGADSTAATLTYRASGLPGGLSINSTTGLITGTTTTVGQFPVTVTASDASGASATAAFTWTVTTVAPPPVQVTITNPGAQSTPVRTAVTLQIRATDSSGAALSYRAVGLPAGLAINASTALISGVPTAAGNSTVTITAADPSGFSAGTTFSWTVTSSTAPATVTVTAPANRTTELRYAITVQIIASDSVGSKLAYKASNLPPGFVINASTGVISGTSTNLGTSVVTVTATDALGVSGSATFTWTVGTGPTLSIQLSNPGAQTTPRGTAVSLALKPTGTEAFQLFKYQATGLPAGLTINGSSGVISGTPTTRASSTVTVTATDLYGVSVSATFAWTVV